MSQSDPEFVFAGGGTGGHLYPGLAVARAVRQRCPAARITFFTTTRPLDRDLLDREGFDRQAQPVRPLSSKPWHWPGFWLAWRASVAAAARFLRQHRPRAVLGLGGYAAGPPVVAAAAVGVRRAILNPDAVPGKANRHLARRAQVVFTQWDVSHGLLPAGAECRTVGCPIRAGCAEATPDAGRALFRLDSARPVLLVTGASQGARTVNQALAAVWPTFHAAHPEWQLLHLTGPADEAATKAAYAAAGAPAHVLAFTHEMPLALAAADLVVSRAGASTLAELTALGRPSILLPYPYHRDRHQHANAQVLVDAGAAVLLEDRRDAARNAGPLATALASLADPQRRAALAAASRRLARADAAERVAEWLLAE